MAPVYHAAYGDISPELVFTSGTIEPIGSTNASSPPFEAKRLPEFHSFSLKLEGIIDRGAWQEFIASLPRDSILRAKGIIRLSSGPRYYEIINGEYSEKDVPPSLAGRRQSIFTFVSRDALPAGFHERLKGCAKTVTLRAASSRRTLEHGDSRGSVMDTGC
jgi:G3E family GTPase